MDLDLITPATATLEISPADFLFVAFPSHGRMVDPDAGVWINNNAWVSADVVAGHDLVVVPEDDHQAPVMVDVVEHLHTDELPHARPVDLPDYLPTREQMLTAVFTHPVLEIAGAIWSTASAEPGVLLNKLAVTAS